MFKTRIRAVATSAVAAAMTVGGLAVAKDSGKKDTSKSGNGTAQSRQADGQGGGPMGGPGGPHGPGGPGGPGMGFGGPGGGDLTYSEAHVQKDGDGVVIRTDVGEITEVSDSSITIKENDGNEVSVDLDGDTKVFGPPQANGKDLKISDLKVGDKVHVSGEEGKAAEVVGLAPTGTPPAPPKNGKLPKGAKKGQFGPPQGPPPAAGQAPGDQQGSSDGSSSDSSSK